ncbi:NUDIX domain-containing protein [Tessaracoccus terricola]
MPIPEFISDLRRHIGNAPLWLSGAAAVILRDGETGPEVLLIKRSDTGEWALVSGIIDPGEHPVETLRREAMEEASVEIEVGRMLWLTVGAPVTYPNGDQCQFLDHGYLCRWISGAARVGDDEATDVRWFPVDALPTPGRDELAVRVRAALQPGDGILHEF